MKYYKFSHTQKSFMNLSKNVKDSFVSITNLFVWFYFRVPFDEKRGNLFQFTGTESKSKCSIDNNYLLSSRIVVCVWLCHAFALQMFFHLHVIHSNIMNHMNRLTANLNSFCTWVTQIYKNRLSSFISKRLPIIISRIGSIFELFDAFIVFVAAFSFCHYLMDKLFPLNSRWRHSFARIFAPSNSIPFSIIFLWCLMSHTFFHLLFRFA